MNEFDHEVGGSGLRKPPKEEEWGGKEIDLTDNKLSELPESPNCPSLIVLYLQRNYDLGALPPLFFQRMALLQLLDLSDTSIKSLPKSLPKLVALKKLFLRGCKLFMELSPQVGKLDNLEELDLDETQIFNLPVDIGKLVKLRLLKVSFYGHTNFTKRKLQSNKVLHPETISNLSQLTELSIDVDPSDKRWDDSVEAVVKGVCNSKGLRSLSLYLPKVQLLDYISLIYPSLTRFRFILGYDKRRIISRVPHEAEAEFRKWDRCLKFVNGENIPIQIRQVLKISTSFFLDRHANAMNLSEFGNENLKMLKFCLLAECNEMETIIDGSELDPGSAENMLESLQYLSLYYMKNLRSIWKGPMHYGFMSKLKFLALHTCPKLSYIFSHTLLQSFVNLEEFILEDCPKVTSLISHESVKPISDSCLPSLKRLFLLYLPELVSIFNGLFIAPKLESIGFYNCPKLKCLSKRELSSKQLKMIKGESQWWEDIKWNETEWGTRPDYLMHIFSPVNNEEDVMTELAEDKDLSEATIKNEGQRYKDDGKLLDMVRQHKDPWPDCMMEETMTDNVTKPISPPSRRMLPSKSPSYFIRPRFNRQQAGQRDSREHQEICGATSYGSGSCSKAESSTIGNPNKGKLWEEEQDAGGMDKLLADLGYKVWYSDMADAAQKLEQLEMVMGTAQEDGISHLSCDTIHYNPSDLSGWVQSMLTGLNNPAAVNLDPVLVNSVSNSSILGQINHDPSKPRRQQQLVSSNQSQVYNDDSEYDLRAIPGVAANLPPKSESDSESTRKRMKTSIGLSGSTGYGSSSSSPQGIGVSGAVTESTCPVALIDSQETGVRLVHTLMACAEAVQQDNLKLADALVKHIGLLAASQAGAMRKVATYFAEALARRLYRIYPHDSLDPSYTDILQMHFYETCPYLKFAHFTANQAILEAFATANSVHVIDFGLKQGMQWPALMQALALRLGGPPAFRLTGIGPPQLDNSDALQQVGWKLAQLANIIGVEFEFRGFVATSLADLEPEILEIRPPEVEAMAVNSVFELHGLLARPGGIEKVLSSIKAMKPKILTVVEQEANLNGPFFLDRFTEALHYYSSLFDSLEGSGAAPPSQDLVMSELYLGRQICNVVACEGMDRIERHETLPQWRTRMETAGFSPVHLGSNACKQASMLLALLTGGDGYRVEENNGCLMLGWHTRPLIATSAWQLTTTESG